MKKLLWLAGVIVFLAGSAVYAEDAGRTLKELAATAAEHEKGKTGEYARENLVTARDSIAAGEAAKNSGNEKVALQLAELAKLQIFYAEAKAKERESMEEIAVLRVELKKSEAQLEKILEGGGN